MCWNQYGWGFPRQKKISGSADDENKTAEIVNYIWANHRGVLGAVCSFMCFKVCFWSSKTRRLLDLLMCVVAQCRLKRLWRLFMSEEVNFMLILGCCFRNGGYLDISKSIMLPVYTFSTTPDYWTERNHKSQVLHLHNSRERKWFVLACCSCNCDAWVCC